MSFEEQERVLFDLLFDSTVRNSFCNDAKTALASYELNDAERHDFAEIRPDALRLDAEMRCDILLSHFCRAFPVSFAIASSLVDGRALLMKLIDTETMRNPSLDRPTVLGTRLREALTRFDFDIATEQTLIIAILDAELAMAWTSATLKRAVLESRQAPAEALPIADDWSSRAVKLAAYVGAAIIPRSYTELKQAFCAVADSELWTRLGHSPVSKALRKKILKEEHPRLLIMRAYISHMSYCEPMVAHRTAELSEGFAPLLQHINGMNTVEQILAQLRQTGASGQILQGVKTGFRQLLETGMLELVTK